MYLKISISDFLTLFAARTRWWFWERRPGLYLSISLVVATGLSTLFSIKWDGFFGQGAEGAYMIGLAPSTTLCVWVYCIIWFIIQVRVRVRPVHVARAERATAHA